MAAWELTGLHWQGRSGGNWSYLDWEVASGAEYSFRGFFSVGNGTGPINTGDLQVQRYVSGAWEDWPGKYAKFVEPWHGIFVGDIIVWQLFINEGTWPTRLKLDWDGGPYYSDEVGPRFDDLVVTGTAVSEVRRVTARARSSAVTAGGKVLAANAEGRLAESVAGAATLGSDAVGRSLSAVASGHVLDVEATGRLATAVAAGRTLGVDANGHVLDVTARTLTEADARGRTLTATARGRG